MPLRFSFGGVVAFGRGTLAEPLYRNAFLLILNTALGGVFGFAFWLVVARFYSSEAVGLTVSLLGVAGLIGALSSLGFGPGLIRFLPSRGDEASSMVRTSLILTLGVSAVVGLAFLVGLNVWSPQLAFVGEHWVYGLMFVGLAAGFALTPLVDSSFLAARKASYVLDRSLVYNVLRVVLAVTVVSALGAIGIFFSFGFALLAALIVGVFYLLPRLYPGFLRLRPIRPDEMREMFAFSFANHAANLLSILPRSLLPLVVLAALSASSSAYFYITWMIAGFLFVIPGSSAVSAFMEGSQPGNYMRETTVRSLRFGLILLLPGILFLVFGGSFLLELFGAEYSTEGLGLLRILALSAFFVAINSTFFSYLRVAKKVGELVILSSVIGIGIIVVSYLLLPGLGIVGTGVAFFAVQGAISAFIVLRNPSIAREIAMALVRFGDSSSVRRN